MSILRGVLTDARDAARRAETLFDLREAYRGRSSPLTAGGSNLLATIEYLFVRPVTDIRKLEDSLKAARRLVNHLEVEGVLKEITERRCNRVYAAREIVQTLQGSLGEE